MSSGQSLEKRQFGRAGIAEDFFDAERAEETEGGVLDGEGFALGLGGFAGAT